MPEGASPLSPSAESPAARLRGVGAPSSDGALASALAQARLPLVSPDGERQSAPAAAPAADPAPDADGWVACGDLRVKGGTYGVDFVYTPGAVQYDGADYGTSDVVEVLTSAPLTFSDAAGCGKDAPGTTGIQVNPAAHADITLAGVHIVHRMPFNIMTNTNQDRLNPANPTRCHITLADGSSNLLKAHDGVGNNGAGIRLGETSVLVIDDSVRNTTKPGGNVHDQANEVVPVNGVIGGRQSLSDGTQLFAGDPISKLDSINPGTLEVWGGCNAAGIGGTNRESAGRLTVNGGNICVRAYQHTMTWGSSESANYQAAGIGGGNCGGITGLTFNAGSVYAEAQCHGAAIGSGTYYLTTRNNGTLWPDAFHTPDTADAGTFLAFVTGGDININGGFIAPKAPNHGNAFGDGCSSSNNGHIIRVTGGTLLPDTSISESYQFDLGLKGGHLIITGGSVNCTKTGTDSNGNDTYKFNGIGGTAWGNDACLANGYDPSDPDDPNKVFKVTVNLTSEIEKRNAEAGITGDDLNDVIKTWSLTVGGQPYAYGAPTTFDEGKLYLWLPKSAIQKEIAVELSYIDKNGAEQKIEPLFRDPSTDQSGDVLKRYIDFELPASYLASLTKHYDGIGFETFDLAAQKPPLTGLVTDADGNRVSDGKQLTDPTKVTYKYQPYDKRGGSPTGPEVSADANGKPLSTMPADVGVMKFTMDSSQWSDTAGFKDSYWGHRAIGWCEIKPSPSKVASVKAAWADGADVADPSDPSKMLKVEADVTSGIFDDGTPTAPTCKAPEGKVQLYVDGEPVGDAVEIRLSPSTAPDGTVLPANARVERDADGREHTVVSWSFAVGDLMAAGETHRVSARYLPSKNYQESADPATGDVPGSEVAVRPDASVAPAPKLAKRAENLTHPDGPTQPGDRVRYTVTASNAAAGSLWTGVVLTDPLPACLQLVASSVTLTGADGAQRALTAAAPGTAPVVGQYALAAAGADGRCMLEAPVGDLGGGGKTVLAFECTVREDLDFSDPASVDLANVASATGKRPNPDDPDGPDVGPVAPPDTPPATPPGGQAAVPADPGAGDVGVTKSVENLTRPDGAVTKIDDWLRYTVTLRNDGPANSALWDAVLSDPLPAGIEPVPGTLRLTGPLGAPDEQTAAVPDAAYDVGSRTIAVAVGHLWGGQAWTLSFECEVTADAVGGDAANVAFAHGTPPSDDPGRDPSEPGADPGSPATPPAPGDGPAAESDPISPAPVVGDDPEEGDVAIAKTAENASRGDGTTHVGDTVRYEIALRNEGAGTSWMDAVVRDDVPEGLEPVCGTIRLTLPDGSGVAVDDAAYDPATRVLAVAVGHLHGGQAAVLRFDALVTEAAVGADIGNVAVGYGTPPSAWDPDGESPEPG
ncbi:hypothetical protein VJ918_11580, partial [Adlercreutzia sp. R21]|uniref:hypothetical protein n=1 Tax=Adlercreutzia wanghongyangiae TaxID=3111451 RepID=UPI002DB65BF7